MKFFIKLLLFMILLCPFSIFALVDYGAANELLNNYTVDFNKDKLYISSVNGRLQYNLLSVQEFNIESSKGGSYLINNGLEFWTSTPASGGKYYVIREGLDSKASNRKSNVRAVATLKENVIISGNGTLTDPWYFPDVIEISFSINNKFGSDSWLSPIPCNQSFNNKRDNITVYYSPGGRDISVYFCGADGYKPSISFCDLSAMNQLVKKNGSDSEYIISNIHNSSLSKLSCSINFIP